MNVFQAAIAAATSPVMIGMYLGGFMFFLGLLPAIGVRVITASLDDIGGE